MKKWMVSTALAALVAVLAVPALADDKTPDATIRLSEGSVAAGIGWNWGKGTLTYGGKTYPVKISGSLGGRSGHHQGRGDRERLQPEEH